MHPRVIAADATAWGLPLMLLAILAFSMFYLCAFAQCPPVLENGDQHWLLVG